MNQEVEIYPSFKYPISQSFRQQMSAKLKKVIKKLGGPGGQRIGSVHLTINDEIHPHDSKKRLFKCVINTHLNGQAKEVVIKKRGARLPKVFNELLRAFQNKLASSMNKRRDRKRAPRKHRLEDLSPPLEETA